MQGSVEFSNVHFSYPSRPEVSVFCGLDLVVPSGSVTAVVGSSGSGKSTLPALLMRFYDPACGVLRIDGTDVRDFSPHWLRSHMSIVHQVLASVILLTYFLFRTNNLISVTSSLCVYAVWFYFLFLLVLVCTLKTNFWTSTDFYFCSESGTSSPQLFWKRAGMCGIDFLFWFSFCQKKTRIWFGMSLV